MEQKGREFWMSLMDDIREGKAVMVRLTDEQTIEEARNRGDSLEGIDYMVESIRYFKDNNGFSESLFMNIVDGGGDEDETLIFVVKIVDDAIDYRIHYQDDEFEPRTREELVEDEELWLFEPEGEDLEDVHEEECEVDDDDESEEDFYSIDLGDLEYTDSFTQETEDGETFEFNLKSQGVLVGTSTVVPKESGIDDKEITVVAEYSSDDDVDNPDILITEIGNGDDGGVITVMPGALIDESEITVLR